MNIIMRYCTFEILYRKKTANRFFFIVLQTSLFTEINPHGLYLGFAGEEKFYFGSFCFASPTFYPPIHYTHLCDKMFPKLA